jgi:hypothetical protein
MNGQHVLEELSAYLDGQAEDGARIQRHLQSCPDCARRHLELLQVREHVRALEAPRVSPDFAERVLADIEAATPARDWSGWFSPRICLAGAAAGLLLVAGLWLSLEPAVVPQPLGPEIAEERLLDDEATLAVYAELLEDGGLSETAMLGAVDGPDNLPVDTFVSTLADSSGPEAPVDWYDDGDLMDVLEQLAAEDPDTLSELLKTHWEDG